MNGKSALKFSTYMLGRGRSGFWLSYQRGSFLLKEFHYSRRTAADRANSLASQVAYVKFLDESQIPHGHIRALLADAIAIEVDIASNRLIL